MTPTVNMRVYFNLFCRDIEAQQAFYQALLGLPELAHKRSAIYRALDAGSTELGFNAPAAYDLLALAGRQPQDDAPPPVTGYATFMLGTPAAVETAAQAAAALGGRVVKPPYATYYRERQAVLQDPEGHVFRVSCELPAGQ